MHGVRMTDLFHPAEFRERLNRIVDYKNRLLAAMLPDFQPFDPRRWPRNIWVTRRSCDRSSGTRRPGCTSRWPGQAAALRGRQGRFSISITAAIPYVTSSNSSAAGIAAGSGVPTRHIDRWIGIVKAYTTRVGGGPFPTEQDNADRERIRQVGREYGTVTGRPRRCGWFDAVAARYSARVSGATEIAIMLLDVLSGIDELKVAVAYERNGTTVTELPASLADFDLCRPIYESLPGWSEDLTGIRRWSDLPRAAPKLREFHRRGRWGLPASIVSVGPDRRQTIMVSERTRA